MSSAGNLLDERITLGLTSSVVSHGVGGGVGGLMSVDGSVPR